MEFRELIAGLAQKVGIKDKIEFDDEERCLINFDGMDVIIQGVDAIRTVAIVAPVGEPPPEHLEMLYRMLLEANHIFEGTGGATFSVNPEGGYVYLCQQIDTRSLNLDEFAKILERFLNVLATWRTLVNEYRARPEKVPAVASETPESSLDNFLRV